MLFSCSSPHSIMQSWVGHRESELYQRWGYPTQIVDKGNDGKIAIYMPAGDKEKDRRIAYCDAKFTSNCIPIKTKEYRELKLFYITAMGNIYRWKMETFEKFSTSHQASFSKSK